MASLVIPSMGGTEIGPWLERYAMTVPKRLPICELGTWLGAGTFHLAKGAESSQSPIYCYDRWYANSREVQKAAQWGLELEEGQNLLPLTMKNLRGTTARILYTKGNIDKLNWRGGPIGLYVDDMNKDRHRWQAAMKKWGRSFVPGTTVLILMDFHFGPFSAQREFLARNPECFSQLEDRPAETTTAIFLCLSTNWSYS